MKKHLKIIADLVDEKYLKLGQAANPCDNPKFHLPDDHQAFMVLDGWDREPTEDDKHNLFSCANCVAFVPPDDSGVAKCKSPDYVLWMGTNELVHPETKEPIKNAYAACSDFFTPISKK